MCQSPAACRSCPEWNVRKVAGDLLKKRPGCLEELSAELGLCYMPRGLGRAGERVGMLVAVTEWLAAKAKPGAGLETPQLCTDARLPTAG